MVVLVCFGAVIAEGSIFGAPNWQVPSSPKKFDSRMSNFPVIRLISKSDEVCVRSLSKLHPDV
jgi:hypothetical protein